MTHNFWQNANALLYLAELQRISSKTQISKTQIYYLSPQSTHIKNVNYLITNARVAPNQNIECTR